MRRDKPYFIYSQKSATSSKSAWYAMFEVFSSESWLAITSFYVLLILIAMPFETNFSLYDFSWALISIGKAFFGKSLDTRIFKENLKFSKYLLIFNITLTGSLIFLHFTGLLISFLAAPTTSFPIKSLNDLLSKNEFRLIFWSWRKATLQTTNG